MKSCNQCGKCCLQYADGGLSATTTEIEHWQLFNPEIASYTREGEIWVDPVSGKPLSRCPWLESSTEASGRALYSCAIYDDRPADCRHYPVSIAEMQRDGCEMLEVIDLQRPRQAQAELDRIMSDSRPPFS